MRYGCIYKIINKINNKIYIGKTIKSLEERFKEHTRSANWWKENLTQNHKLPYNSRLYAAMNLYGSENFKITLIEDLIPEDKLADKEKYYIAYFNSTDDTIGYNISLGGMGGSLFKGHKHSQYSKNIISEKLKNKPQSESFIKKRSYARARLLQNLSTGEIVSIMDIKKGYFYFQNIINYRVYKSNGIFYACLESPHNRRPALSLEACLDLKNRLEQCFKDRHAKTIIALKLGYNKAEAQEKRRLATKKLATIKKQKYWEEFIKTHDINIQNYIEIYKEWFEKKLHNKMLSKIFNISYNVVRSLNKYLGLSNGKINK